MGTNWERPRTSLHPQFVFDIANRNEKWGELIPELLMHIEQDSKPEDYFHELGVERTALFLAHIVDLVQRSPTDFTKGIPPFLHFQKKQMRQTRSTLALAFHTFQEGIAKDVWQKELIMFMLWCKFPDGGIQGAITSMFNWCSDVEKLRFNEVAKSECKWPPLFPDLIPIPNEST